VYLVGVLNKWIYDARKYEPKKSIQSCVRREKSPNVHCAYGKSNHRLVRDEIHLDVGLT